jgi:hypothetical protein
MFRISMQRTCRAKEPMGVMSDAQDPENIQRNMCASIGEILDDLIDQHY